MGNNLILGDNDFRITELCCEVSALCVFIDIREFTSLSTALDQEDVGTFLSLIRLDILRGDKEFDLHKQADRISNDSSWEDRYRERSKNIWDLYNYGKELSTSGQSISYPYCVALIQNKHYPLFAYYRFLGDGILLVFELAPAHEFSWAVEDAVKDEFVKKLAASVSKQDHTLLDKKERERVILEWISELGQWSVKSSWAIAFHGGERIRHTALGIGVSEGIIIRHVTRDKYRHGTGPINWDYYGDALNRAARLENLAKPGGVVWDVTDGEFRMRLHDCWYKLMHELRGGHKERPYYFAKYVSKEDIKGIGHLELYASGAVGSDHLNKADHLEIKEGIAKEIREAFKENCAYKTFGKIPSNPFLREADINSIAHIIIRPSEQPLKVKVKDSEFNSRSAIESILGPEAYEQWQIRTIANKRKDLNLFEGKVVRLQNFSNEKIQVAVPSGYYWSGSIDYRLDYFANTSPFSGADLIKPKTFEYDDNVNGECYENPRIREKRFNLKNSPLGNHLGINLLLYGAHPSKKDRWLILLQSRSGLVHVEKGKLCPSASGTINAEDCQGNDDKNDYSLRLGAVREFRRELGINIDENDERITFSAITREYERLGTPDAFYNICVSDEKDKLFILEEGGIIMFNAGMIDDEIPEKEEWEKLFFLEVDITPCNEKELGSISNVYKVKATKEKPEFWLLKNDEDLLSKLKLNKFEENNLFGKPCITALHCLLKQLASEYEKP